MSEYVRHVEQLNKNFISRLGSLDIELIERCNNNCIHCCVNLPADDLKAKAKEMSTDQVKAILDEAVTLGCMEVRFTGGEPLIRPDFKELYLYARKLGLKVIVFTNGRLINAELANLFARIPPLLKIEITVYGMRSESYEAVSRVPGSFFQFRQGVALLHDRGIPFILKSALLPPNRHEIEEFEAWNMTFPWANKIPDYAMFFDLRNRRDDRDKNRMIASLRLTPAEGLKVLTRNEERYRNINQEFSEKFMGPPGDQLFHCGIGNSLCIDPYGFAYPCLAIRAPELSLDLLKNKSSSPLNDALVHFKDLRKLKATNPSYLTRCAICFLKGFCSQCPSKSWAEHGTYDTPVEYYCAVAHAQAYYMGWLKKDEKAWTVKKWRDRIRKTDQKAYKRISEKA